jgi:hypothetical protein
MVWQDSAPANLITTRAAHESFEVHLVEGASDVALDPDVRRALEAHGYVE